MDYQPKLPSKNYNISPRHPLREFAILVSSATLLLLLFYWLLGVLVDVIVDALPQSVEIAIHQQLQRPGSYALPDTVEQGQQQLQLAALLEQLNQCAKVSYPVQLHLVDSELSNAVAIPGGHIMVFSGAFNHIESQNGLAFVLAHELAHFKQRDHLRGMGRSIVLIALSALISDNSDVLNLLTPVTEYSSAQFSQQRESLADSLALDILQCHYGHVGGASQFFKQLASSQELESSGFEHYFSSHPLALVRIADLEKMIIKKGYSTGQTTALTLD